jgi:hypothetical protein
MAEACDFISALARAGKSRKVIKTTLHMETIPCQLIKLNCIIKAIEEGQNTSDQHLSNTRKTMRAGDIV